MRDLVRPLALAEPRSPWYCLTENGVRKLGQVNFWKAQIRVSASTPHLKRGREDEILEAADFVDGIPRSRPPIGFSPPRAAPAY